MPLAWTLDADNEESDEFSGAQINRRHRDRDYATLQFGGTGNYEFVLENNIPTGEDQPDMGWTEIGTYTQADASKTTVLVISTGVLYRFRRISGEVNVAMQA